jgi:hypothetical protein
LFEAPVGGELLSELGHLVGPHVIGVAAHAQSVAELVVGALALARLAILPGEGPGPQGVRPVGL